MTTSESLTIPSARSGQARDWQVQIVRDESALTGVAVEWDDLCERCSTATAFLSSAWLLSWWRSYGQAGRLVVVLLRRDGRLVAAAAMMRNRRMGIPVLTPLGLGVSDFTDVLLDDSCAAEAAGHLARELIRLGGWQVIDLPEVPAPLGHRAADGRVAVPEVGGTRISVPRASGGPDPRAHRDPAQANRAYPTHEAAQNRGAGHRHRRCGREAASEAAAALLRLHRQQWRGRGMNR